MKVLFFSPYSGIWEHSFPETIVIKSLLARGHEVIRVTCDGTLSRYCITMAAKGIAHHGDKAAMKAVCEECISTREVLASENDGLVVDLKDLITAEDQIEARKILENTTRENYLELKVEEIPVGRIALYETVLQHKKLNLVLTDAQWLQYKDSLFNALLCLFAAKRGFEKFKPDRFCSYASLYSTNQMWKLWADKVGAAAYLIQGGPHLAKMHQTLMLVRDSSENGIPYYSDALKLWEEYKNIPVVKEGADLAAGHFLRLFRGGGFVFSAPKESTSARKHWNIPDDKKIVIAALSSMDEILAAEVTGHKQFPDEILFSDRFEWVKELIAFATKRKDLFLIIRPHPREFPSQRSAVLAESAQKLQDLMRNLPDNVVVNTPSDGLSLYDLFMDCNLLLNGWSTVGSEAPLFGIPVVAYMKMGWYPTDLNFIGETREEYFKKIDEALALGWSKQRVVLGMRWFSLLFYWGVLDLSQYIVGESHTLSERLRRKWRYYQQRIRCKLDSKRSPFEIRQKLDLSRIKKIHPTLTEMIGRVMEEQHSSLAALRLEAARKLLKKNEEPAVRGGVNQIIKQYSNGKGSVLSSLTDYGQKG